MSGETLFVSDLHLDPGRPEITALLLDFLAGPARRADALYILGDLFEVWLGDDDTSSRNREITGALRRLSDTGVPVYVMHGNRDFLMGGGFEAASGCSLLPDPTVIDLYGTPTLLMHGDTLCTDDLEYQRFRAMVRNPDAQRDFLAKSLEERAGTVRALREQSRESTRTKPREVMDVNQQAVEQALRRHGVLQLIHGHTHRPAAHKFPLDGKPARRIVLGDWYVQGSLLRCTAAGCNLERLTQQGG